MIKEKGFSGNPMFQKETFESFYTRKLGAIIVKLKDIIKGDTPYATSAEYACKICSGRVKLHSQGRIYCLICQVPLIWPKGLKASVFQILQGYPALEESRKEWESAQVPPNTRVRIEHLPFRPENIELGDKMREARKRLGLTHKDLARKIHKKDGFSISMASIQGYEIGRAYPREYILEQINNILGI